ncbi:protein lethal(2)essential for life-like [Venturia canescens]|uniref:protein lethal(2)essential for life-like n=1 Tax=Venturia canescens TaxID=32260 RepID=UPI001C9CC21A|nr:protein lethal(2)essential for life-like [Venturia canescens]
MSLIPMLFSNWWDELDRPHRISDQHFGLPLSTDLIRSAIAPEPEVLVIRPSVGRRLHHYHPYEKSLMHRRSGGTSTVRADKDKFLVSLDVQQFSPEEVSVKVVDRNVIIEGKHEEKQDEHGWISRQFVRKYLVPEQCDIDQLKSSLSSDGVLSIEAPRKHDPKDKKERVIQIENTGQPAIQDGDAPKTVETQKTTTRAQEKASKNVKAA